MDGCSGRNKDHHAFWNQLQLEIKELSKLAELSDGKVKVKVTQSCLTLGDPMDYSLPGSSIHGIFQARVLEWDAIAFSVEVC